MNRLRSLLAHSVTQNAAALCGIQFAGYIIPLVTLPYLARVLRPDGFGLLLFSQSFALWASLTIEYGFNLSATREIARLRSDREALASTASGVLGAKLLLFLGLVFVALIAWSSIATFRGHPAYFLWALLQTLAFGFSPFWYFQGTERMVRAVVVESLCRGGATAFIFLLVRRPYDGWRALALQAAAGILTLTIQTAWMYREIPFRRPRFGNSLRALRTGWDMFIFRGAYHIYGTANAFILGLFAPSMQAVGLFGGAERIARALQGLTTPLTQALYPHMSHTIAQNRLRAARLARWTLALSCGTALVLALLLLLLARPVVGLILGPSYGPSVSVLYVLACVLPINAMNGALIMQWMLPSGMERLVGKITIGAIGINLIVAACLAPGWGPIGMAWAILIAESCKALTLAAVLARGSLSPVRPSAVAEEGASAVEL